MEEGQYFRDSLITSSSSSPSFFPSDPPIILGRGRRREDWAGGGPLPTLLLLLCQELFSSITAGEGESGKDWSFGLGPWRDARRDNFK